MKIGYGKENNEFLIGFNHGESNTDLEKESDIISFAIGAVHGKQINFRLTSMDRYVQDFIVGSSNVRVIGDNYQTLVYSADENLISKLGKIMEDKLKSENS